MESIDGTTEIPSVFLGAKLLLFFGESLVVIQRDDRPDIPFPGHWDLPGGGREGLESPADCVLRETREEIGVPVDRDALIWSRSYGQGASSTWMFAAHLPAARSGEIVLGDEGQRCALMLPRDYAEHPLAIPHFVVRLRDYLGD